MSRVVASGAEPRRDSVPAPNAAAAPPPTAPPTLTADGTSIARCDEPVGTIAVVEPQDVVMVELRRYNLQSPTQLIRMMIQQSNCFQVVERGAAMQRLMQERVASESGSLRPDPDGGRLRPADYVLTTSVLFSEGNAGGVGGALGGALGRRVGLGAVAGGLKFKEAQTTMTVADVRSAVQVAAAQGQAKKRDFALGAFGWAGGAAGALGGYTNTNEGKVIAASFVDNYNQIVASIRANPDLRRAAPDNASARFAEGDLLVARIDNVRVFASPSATASVVATLRRSDEVVFLGEERGGYLKVQGSAGEGWVSKPLLAKR